jgi:hypothetical protein
MIMKGLSFKQICSFLETEIKDFQMIFFLWELEKLLKIKH